MPASSRNERNGARPTTLLALGPAEFRKIATAETARWQKPITDNKINLEEQDGARGGHAPCGYKSSG